MAFERKNPLKLNNLQLRTLVLAQIVARDENTGRIDDASGDGEILRVPHAHGDHVHVGKFVVAARDASGFANPAVWVALARKGLAHDGFPGRVALTRAGMEYDTGLAEHFVESDH